MKKPATCFAVASVLLVAACGDDTEDAMSAVCDAQTSTLESVAALASLDPATATADDLEDGLSDLSDSVDDLKDARGNMNEQDVDNVTSALDDLKSSLSDLDDVPLAELESNVTIEVIEAVAAFQVAYDTAYENSSC
ncbi:hypothetical protein [Ilumatobacter sp.]|uniref:hypothetical protein n=1 Tax=Ilumatobacter sp. TaxID=1967498 RepID=UPI003AF554AB